MELKLALPVVLPLLDLFRELAGGTATLPAATPHRDAIHREVGELMALFGADFPQVGKINISEAQAPAILRACAWMRLRMRHEYLATVPDETLETVPLKHDDPQDPNYRAVMCYLFLATLEESILQNLTIHPTLSDLVVETHEGVMGFLRRLFRRPPKPAPSVPLDPTSWRVVLLNDPVNLMSYVTTVLQRVLHLPADVARRHMREVHELKRSVVWQGPREKAAAYALELQAWHLTAELQPADRA